MKCPECSNKISFSNKIRLITISDKVSCDECGCVVKRKTSKLIFILNLIDYCILFLIGIMFYREGFSIYVVMILLIWIVFDFFINIAITKVEKDK